MNDRIRNILLLIIVALAAVLRFFSYSDWSLSNDELSALARLQFSSFFELIAYGVMPDFHPAGVQIFLYYWTKIFGISEASVRLPFVLAGIASVWTMYLIGKKLFSPDAGLMMSAALAVLEFPILFSQVARPYSPGLLFTLLAFYFWTRIMSPDSESGPGKKSMFKYCTGFVISASACMYIHYFALMQAGLICIAGFFFVTRKNVKAYLFSCLLIVLLYIPHVQIFLFQMQTGGIGGEAGWLGPPESDFFRKYIQFAFNHSKLLLISAILLFVTMLITNIAGKNNLKITFTLLLLFFLPFLIGYYYSHWRNPVLQNSVLLFSFPFLLIALFSFVTNPVKPFLITCSVSFILLTGSYATVISNKFYSTQHFGVFRELAEKTAEYNFKYGSDRISKTINIHNPYYIQYYLDRLQLKDDFKLYLCYDYQQVKQMIAIVNRSNTEYFQHGWSNIYDLPETEGIIRSKYPFIAERSSYFNSGITLFARDSIPGGRSDIVFSLINDFEKNLFTNEKDFLDSSFSYSGTHSARLDESREFGPTFEVRADSLHLPASFKVILSARIYPLQSDLKTKLVISIDKNDKNLSWYGREIKYFVSEEKQWQRAFAALNCSIALQGDEIIKAYFWNDGKERLYADDFKIEILKINEDENR